MSERFSHHKQMVDTWSTEARRGLRPTELVQLYDLALAALWGRANQTISEITLLAIADRVLSELTEKYRSAHALGSTPSRIEMRTVLHALKSPDPEEIREVGNYVLCSFLSILGGVTEGIITPALHSALSKIRLSSGAKPDDANEKEG